MIAGASISGPSHSVRSRIFATPFRGCLGTLSPRYHRPLRGVRLSWSRCTDVSAADRSPIHFSRKRKQIDNLDFFPLGEDALHLPFRSFDGILGAHFITGDLGEHGWDDEGAEDLVDGSGGVARIANVRGIVNEITEDPILIRRLTLRILGNQFLQVRHRVRKAGEVIKFALKEGGAVV